MLCRSWHGGENPFSVFDRRVQNFTTCCAHYVSDYARIGTTDDFERLSPADPEQVV